MTVWRRRMRRSASGTRHNPRTKMRSGSCWMHTPSTPSSPITGAFSFQNSKLEPRNFWWKHRNLEPFPGGARRTVDADSFVLVKIPKQTALEEEDGRHLFYEKWPQQWRWWRSRRFSRLPLEELFSVAARIYSVDVVFWRLIVGSSCAIVGPTSY